LTGQDPATSTAPRPELPPSGGSGSPNRTVLRTRGERANRPSRPARSVFCFARRWVRFRTGRLREPGRYPWAESMAVSGLVGSDESSSPEVPNVGVGSTPAFLSESLCRPASCQIRARTHSSAVSSSSTNRSTMSRSVTMPAGSPFSTTSARERLNRVRSRTAYLMSISASTVIAGLAMIS